MTKVQIAWEGLSNTMRLYIESKFRFDELMKVDKEEAINNMDRAFEAKLEKFHALYDVTKKLPGFDYFGHGDTSLMIVLRNALHHRDHALFVSWNAHIGLQDGMRKYAGVEFLLASTTPETNESTARFYFPLYDFYTRLANPLIKSPTALRELWNADLQFASMAKEAAAHRYPDSQVYVDVMPAFMSAVRRVSRWLEADGFQPHGFDGQTYIEHFSDLTFPEELGYKRLRLPNHATPRFLTTTTESRPQ